MSFMLPLALLAAVGAVAGTQPAGDRPKPDVPDRPAIDRGLPAEIETATFALG
jgi:hypothetical protein